VETELPTVAGETCRPTSRWPPAMRRKRCICGALNTRETIGFRRAVGRHVTRRRVTPIAVEGGNPMSPACLVARFSGDSHTRGRRRLRGQAEPGGARLYTAHWAARPRTAGWASRQARKPLSGRDHGRRLSPPPLRVVTAMPLLVKLNWSVRRSTPINSAGSARTGLSDPGGMDSGTLSYRLYHIRQFPR